MTPERKEQGGTRQAILHLLRRKGHLTATELSEELGIGAVGVRQHLGLLERDGLVEIVGVRRNVGRPSHLYKLTEAAERYFPKHYDQLAIDLLNFLNEHGGPAAVEAALDHRRQQLVIELTPLLAGKSRCQQVATLTEVLVEQGYMCECEQLADGSFLLTEHNCPIDCVARQHPALCAQELRLYEELLDAELTRESTIAEGAQCCRYRIPA